MSKKIIPEKGTFQISPEFLLLDSENPRLFLPDMGGKVTEGELIKALAENSDLKELIFSIANNGFLDMEPLIVIDDKKKTGYYRVLEGNRRLAAIKIIKDPEIAYKCRIKLPEMSVDILSTMDEISVYRVQSEEDARSFIGFKHVNGPHKWDSYAKAQFAYRWYREERDQGVTIDAIARKLGDTNKTVQSLISSMFLLEQAKENDIYDLSDRTTERFSLSHFYTALGRREYMDFLGLERGWNNSPIDNPIPYEREANLRDVLVGLYGSKDEGKESVIKSQNPDVKKFGEILVNPVAYNSYKNGASFEEAYFDTGDANGKLTVSLIAINSLLDKASVLLDKIEELEPSNYKNIVEMRNKFDKVEFQAKRRANKE
ncbi:ParB/RepB/Spo0J family partition protein [Serratia fonticola]|uniref:ParB/Srx family N-terminal domain-containing protein n=1 Tax=Serratia fonticola TaxID=47917 RepID=A0AAE7JS74_SERFO|nr:ParB/Srx family N-terminal domain-containing protein [Serratia fonticola]QKJ57617.1 ParB/Srx family N-terminal domain-containing protein [Serratia fonticola]